MGRAGLPTQTSEPNEVRLGGSWPAPFHTLVLPVFNRMPVWLNSCSDKEVIGWSNAFWGDSDINVIQEGIECFAAPKQSESSKLASVAVSWPMSDIKMLPKQLRNVCWSKASRFFRRIGAM